MISEGIACQVHIPDSGHHGDNLTSDQKVKVVELSIELLRHKNPNTYIAFSGHGKKPSSKFLDLCDFVHWENIKHRKAAQYDSVHEAVNNCKEKGIKNILKVRGDGVYGIYNFAEHCNNILKTENKKLLITQMTADRDKKLGDCVMYGDTDLIKYLWDKNHPEHHWDGLVHLGVNFFNYFSTKDEDWNSLLKQYCSFRNISSLQWMDLRYNFKALEQLGWNNVRSQLLNDEFDLRPWYWGRNNGWHTFDNTNKMVYSIEPYYYEEVTFYENL